MTFQRQLTSWAFMALGACALSACGSKDSNLPAGSWQAEMGRLRVAVRGDDADPAFAARWGGYRKHLTEVTGLPVELFEATDYNGVVQAISSGQVDMATMGASSYANVAAQVGDKVAPFVIVRQAEGTKGYYSAIAVKAGSSFRSLNDLKGKTLAYVDFNSTSGYVYPRKTMREQGVNPDTFFGRSIMAGGATQALVAMANGRVDAAMVTVSAGTPETGFAAGSHITAGRRGLIKPNEIRLIWTAGPMPNSPFVVRTDRPAPMIDVLRGALAMLPYEKPDVWEEMGQVAGGTFASVNKATYAEVLALRDEDISKRRAGGSSK
ncbi:MULTISPECIES: phosphate/phosphite/phosphonate ABC transporter substrate-binding protein [unclassified Novosphingobium]|uniref:phosphate/phosphite/phosphonate ABC transporter substrate-binding protein n=1 Tax=unclassified Novosphingobium TaxID=2644732 RepID=UPI0025F67886|nr:MULTISPECIES: phosphate/phosphite/phosphonate ABC transporter substrate-binding protein [unclassified Novosphingobium]